MTADENLGYQRALLEITKFIDESKEDGHPEEFRESLITKLRIMTLAALMADSVYKGEIKMKFEQKKKPKGRQ